MRNLCLIKEGQKPIANFKIFPEREKIILIEVNTVTFTKDEYTA